MFSFEHDNFKSSWIDDAQWQHSDSRPYGGIESGKVRKGLVNRSLRTSAKQKLVNGLSEGKKWKI